jgi:23S rRNA-/tRNA-specific pseudouridylate synthase
LLTLTGRLHDTAIQKGNKQYIALVQGEWKNNEINGMVLVDFPLTVKNATKVTQTKFTLLAMTTIDNIKDHSSLVLCDPLTWCSTHQI